MAIALSGFWLGRTDSQQAVIAIFEITAQGRCCFDSNNYYQLQVSSRFSFLGCWLVLQPVKNLNALGETKVRVADSWYFIYRDSLDKQDFSCLSNVISQLQHSCRD